MRYAAAIETPAVSITGGEGVNLFPDVIFRAFHPLQEDGHLQVAGVLRQLRAQTFGGEIRSAWGGGGTVSGVLPFQYRELTDRIIFQVNGGTGIARYINDLQSLGGQDAMVDTTSDVLKPLPALGWYVAYEHMWKVWPALQSMNLHSTVLWSFVTVHNFDFQPPEAFHKTHRLAVNTIFSPSRRVDLGIEYIYGTRTNRDGANGHANQFQAVALCRF